MIGCCCLGWIMSRKQLVLILYASQITPLGCWFLLHFSQDVFVIYAIIARSQAEGAERVILHTLNVFICRRKMEAAECVILPTPLNMIAEFNCTCTLNYLF